MKGRFKSPLNGETVLQWLHERVPQTDPIRIRSVQQYEKVAELGKGRFGAVFKYVDRHKHTPITIKEVNLQIFEHWSQDETRVSHRVDVFIEEFRRLHKISHASNKIANFIGFYTDSSRFLLLTEYLSNGSVKEKLQKEPIPEDTAVRYFTESLDALDYLHSLAEPIVHRDIKASNLLITSNNSIKLANFGLVKDLAIDGFGLAVASEITTDFRGTLLYAAPEVIRSDEGPGNRKAYGIPSDIWALGCTLVEMLRQNPPHFEYFGQVDHGQKEIVDRTQSDDPAEWLPYSSEVLVPSSSELIRQLVDYVFIREPADRPTTKQLKELLRKNRQDQDVQNAPVIMNHVDDCKPSTSKGPYDENDLYAPVKDDPSSNGGEYIKVDLPEYQPLETLHDSVTRRKRSIHKKKRQKTFVQRFNEMQLHYLSRSIFFLAILSKAILYVLLFILVGMGTLSLFLFFAYCIVLFARYLIHLRCNCDISQPQYIIISGILLILLFALMFSCCMVALGEYKFRKANRTLRESRFFIPRPKKDVKFCGITVIRKEKDETEEEAEEIPLEEVIANSRNISEEQNNFYYA